MMQGYEAAHENAATRFRDDRRFLRVHGRDPVRMIQGLVSNDVLRAGPERAVYATVLSPKGKMVCDVRVLRIRDELLIETDATAIDALATHLKKFVPPLFARFDDASVSWSCLGVYGPQARSFAERALDSSLEGVHAQDDMRTATIGDDVVFTIATSYLPHAGFDLVSSPHVLQSLERRLLDDGAAALSDAALDVLRIEAGSPRWGVDIDENTIPLEALSRERAISETKGCYTGQEVIVRILHRGHVNWLLRGALLGDIDPPARDTPLLHTADYRKIGRITSAVRSPVHEQTIALAYARRELTLPAEAHLETPKGPLVRIVGLPFEHALSS